MKPLRCRVFTSFFLEKGRLSTMRKDHSGRLRCRHLMPATPPSVERVERLIKASEPGLNPRKDGFEAVYWMTRNWSGAQEVRFAQEIVGK